MADWFDGEDPDFETREWHRLYFRAWAAVQFERHYGAFGGETPLSYLALRSYAAAEGIGSADWPAFFHFMTALDDEWRLAQAEKRKSQTDGSAAS